MSIRDDDLNELERLSGEVARLREERHEWATKCEDARAAFEKLQKDFAELSSTHEATKAELERVTAQFHACSRDRDAAVARRGRLQAAEARVAELERELVEQELRHVRTREERAALSSARELLPTPAELRADKHIPLENKRKLADLLESHPESATPAGHCDNCVTEGYALCEHESATPADTGAEQEEDT